MYDITLTIDLMSVYVICINRLLVSNNNLATLYRYTRDCVYAGPFVLDKLVSVVKRWLYIETKLSHDALNPSHVPF